jgi:hypothetical protein
MGVNHSCKNINSAQSASGSSTVEERSTLELKVEGSNPAACTGGDTLAGPNVIKLFLSVIYEFS